jgi:thiol-disulfide isomerase/thioredoxin
MYKQLILVAIYIAKVQAFSSIPRNRNGHIGLASWSSESTTSLGLAREGFDTKLYYKNKEYDDEAENTTTNEVTNSAVAVPLADVKKEDAVTKPAISSSRVVSSVKKQSNNIHMVITLDDFREKLKENEDRLLVVRFYSHFCKSCQAITPRFNRLARRNPKVSFLDIPITKDNKDLAEANGVIAVPYAHIYAPNMGLVDEMRIGKMYWDDFEDSFYSYINGYCNTYDGYENPRKEY